MCLHVRQRGNVVVFECLEALLLVRGDIFVKLGALVGVQTELAVLNEVLQTCG
jgi:hypothetical protein